MATPAKDYDARDGLGENQDAGLAAPAGGAGGLLSFADVAKHNTPDDLWIIVNGKAYDLTDFADDHPGGAAVVTEQAGADATEEFLEAHPEDIMTLTLGKAGLAAAFRGNVDPSTIPKKAAAPPKAAAVGAKAANGAEHALDGGVSDDEAPPLQLVLNLHDFEAIAQRVMVARGRKQAWDYYSSGADDELTYNENVNAFQRCWLRPRILVDVATVDTSCRILGEAVRMPVYLSAVAMCGMGHPDGELAWARAAHTAQSVFMVPNLSSKGFGEIIACGDATGQPFFFQIYVNPDRSVVLDQLRACEKAGNVKALCITVDSAVPGKRERDLRNKLAMQWGKGAAAAQQASAAKGAKARKPGTFANRDPALSWSDVAWFRENTSIPIVIKGVQCADDAVMAAEAGAAAIILSNHGGRNLDTSRSGLEVLPEAIAALKEAGHRSNRAAAAKKQGAAEEEKEMEVWIDGGVRRGTDVLKAIALGADAVGLGKPAVYAMSAYGQAGIEKMMDILHTELVTAMRLMGAPSLAALRPSMVNALDLERHSECAPLPASPFAMRRPEKNARSAHVPSAPAEVRAEIVRLQETLAELERSGGAGGSAGGAASAAKPIVARHGVPPLLLAFGQLLLVMVLSVAKTVFATTASGTLHRSALFLIIFLVVHMLGNLSVFAGKEAFNGYGHFLSTHPLTKFIEYYLLAGTLAHVATASYFSYNKRKLLAKKPVARHSILLLTSAVVLVFVVLHLRTFRFAEAGAEAVRDLYGLQMDLFADPKQVAFYLVSLAATAAHVWFGWSKTILKMDITKEQRKPFEVLGHLLVWPLFIGFAVCPVYCYYVQQQQQQQQGAAGAPHGGEL